MNRLVISIDLTMMEKTHTLIRKRYREKQDCKKNKR